MATRNPDGKKSLTTGGRIDDRAALAQTTIMERLGVDKSGAISRALLHLAASLEGAPRVFEEWAAGALPDAVEVAAQRRLAQLARHKGLSKAERSEIDERAMRGVRTLAAEHSRRVGDLMAASGTQSAAAIHGARLTEMAALNTAAIEAADIGIREDRAQADRDRQEERELLEECTRRGRERLKFLGQALPAALIQRIAEFVDNPSGEPVIAPEVREPLVDAARQALRANGRAVPSGRPR